MVVVSGRVSKLSLVRGVLQWSKFSALALLALVMSGCGLDAEILLSGLNGPTGHLSSPSTSHTNQTSIPFEIRFSASVSNFDETYLEVTNGHLINFSGDGKSFTADFIPAGEGVASVVVKNVVILSDEGKPVVVSGRELTFVVDRTSPTPTLSSTSAPSTTVALIPVSIVVDENIESLNIANFNVTNGAITSLVKNTSTTYTATIQAVMPGTVSVVMPQGAFTDAAGNPSNASNALSLMYDPYAPVPTLSSSDSATNNLSVLHVDLSFSTAPVSFDASLLTLENATVQNFTGSGDTFSFELVPTSDGVVRVRVAAGVAQNSLGSDNLASNILSFNIDRVPPTLSISSPTPSSGHRANTFTWTLTYSGQSSITLSAADILLNGANADCVKSISGTGSTRTVSVTGCTGNGSMTLSVAAGTASDAAGNLALAEGPSSAVTLNNSGPTVSLSAPNTSYGNSSTQFSWTVTYTGASTISLAPGNVSLSGATAGCTTSVTGSGTSTRTVNVTGCTDNGSLTIALAAGTAQDSIGNSSAGTVPSTAVTVDNIAPTLVLGNPSPSLGNSSTSFTWDITYTDADFISLSATDLTLTGAAAAGCTTSISTVSPTVRRVTLSNCTTDGQVALTIKAGSARDNAGNGTAAAGPSTTIEINNSALSTVLASTANATTNLSSIPVTVTFAKAVTGFTASDLVLVNGTVTGFSGTGDSYSFNLVPSADGTVSVQVPAGVAQDAFNTENEISNTLSFTVDRVSPTLAIGTPTPTVGNSSTSFSWVVTYSGASSISLQASDVTLTGATTGCTKSVTGTGSSTRTVTVKDCSGDGSLTISIGVNSAQDAAGNQASDEGPSTAVTVDNTAPTLAITGPTPSLGNSSASLVWTLNYTGTSSISLANANITLVSTGTVAGCTATTSGSGTSRSVTVTGCTGDGTVKFNVAAGTGADAAGNIVAANTSAATATIDNTAPTLSLGAPTPTTGRSATSFNWVVTYSNASTISLADTDVTLNGATADCSKSVSGSGNTRTVTVTDCTGDGSLSISIAANSAQDAAGNQAAAAGPSTAVTLDNTAPVLSIGSPTPTLGNVDTDFVFTLSYSGTSSVTLQASNVTVTGTNAGCSVAVSGTGTTSRTVTVSDCTGTGSMGISVASNTAVDAVGNSANAATSASNATLDNTPPSITIGAPSPASGDSTANFSWVVTYVGASSISLQSSNVTLNGATAGCTKSVSGTGTDTRTVTVTGCTGNGNLTISLAAETAQDTVGNKAAAAGPSSAAIVNNIPPTLTVSGPSPSVAMGPAYFSWDLEYSDVSVVTLTESDLSLTTTGTVSDCMLFMSGSGNYYNVSVFNCMGDGTVALKVAANTAQNASGVQVPAHTTSPAGTVDSTAPVLTFSSPAANSEIGDTSNFTVTGTCDEESRQISISPNPKSSVVCSGGAWTAQFNVSASASDTISISVSMQDAAGNYANASRSFMMPIPEQYKVKEIFPGLMSFVALKSDGSLVSWGSYLAGLAPASVKALNAKVIKVFQADNAFAALKSDGSLVVWGDPSKGGTAPTSVTNVSSRVVDVVSTPSAFAALKSDGSVVAWGDPAYGGDAPATVTTPYSKVKKLYANSNAIAALKTDGSVVSWGETWMGGTAPASVTAANSKVKKIIPFKSLFAALKTDGSIVIWGMGEGGEPSTVTASGSKVIDLVKNEYAFAALKSDGTVVAWGSASYGGNAPSTVTAANSKVVALYSSDYAFVARKSDGSLVSWGALAAPASVTAANSGVVKVFSVPEAFAALKANGTVVGWGSGTFQSPPTSVTAANSQVIDIAHTQNSFAALKADGSVVVWGRPGLTELDAPSGVTTANSRVVKIYSTGMAYAALKADSSVVAWGLSEVMSQPVNKRLSGAKASVKYVVQSSQAFAALRSDGKVIAWGDSSRGGLAPASVIAAGSGVVDVVASSCGFTALKSDGTVVAWGQSNDPTTDAPTSSGFVKVIANYEGCSFAGIKGDGSVEVWGNNYYGGDEAPTELAVANAGVVEIIANGDAFAALRADGSVVTWGESDLGGNSPASVTAANSDVKKVIPMEKGFAALKSDGSLVVWGENISTVPSTVTAAGSDVLDMTASGAGTAWAVLKGDGTVVTWGNANFGGSAPASVTTAGSGVLSIARVPSGFAAMKVDGSVVVWGTLATAAPGDVSAANSDVAKLVVGKSTLPAVLKSHGGISTWGPAANGGSAPTGVTNLGSDVKSIVPSTSAMTALKADGTAISWGDFNNGGGTPIDVTQPGANIGWIIPNEFSFTALMADGSVYCWGDFNKGGDCFNVESKDP